MNLPAPNPFAVMADAKSKRAPLHFQEVRTEAQLAAVSKFAESFAPIERDGKTFRHCVDKYSVRPIVVVFRGDRMIGYYHIIMEPIIVPAYHTDPEICSPRDFKEMSEAITYARLQNSLSDRFPNGHMYALLPDPPFIDTSLLQHMGFIDLKQKLYQKIG